jgi:ERCC4-related helicase
LSQKEQQRIIEQFKEGHYNCLVATSIGEEGKTFSGKNPQPKPF